MAVLNLDLHEFFTAVRPLFGNLLTQGQVNGCQALITAWEKTDQTDIRWLAYEMATAMWETGKTMQPVREVGEGHGRPYGAIDMTGKAPYGRGYVQLTWRSNYIKADARLGLGGALFNDYDQALDPAIAAQILFTGMAEGWFTAKKLSDYINDKGCDYFNARRIVNGLDQASRIADYAQGFEAALHASVGAPIPLPERTGYPGWIGFTRWAFQEIFAKLKALF